MYSTNDVVAVPSVTMAIWLSPLPIEGVSLLPVETIPNTMLPSVVVATVAEAGVPVVALLNDAGRLMGNTGLTFTN